MDRLFEIKKTQLELVQSRGYDLDPSEEAIFGMDFRQFIDYVLDLQNQTKNSTRGILTRSYAMTLPDGSSRYMLVYYGSKTEQQKQISADVIREFIKLTQKYQIYEGILIVDAPISSTANDELSALRSTKWQVFQDDDLMYNPTKHVDVPLHVRLSEEQKAQKLEEMRVDVSKLPLIKLQDPIVKFYGWSVGDLIQIFRDDSELSILSPKSINYRIVVG